MMGETETQGQLVCFVIERLFDRSGGAERIVVELANRLGQAGRRVHLVTYERKQGKPFFPLGPNVIHLNLKVPAAHRPLARRTFDRVRDLLHLKLPYPKVAQRAVWWSRRGGFVRALEDYLELHRPQQVVAVAPPSMVALAQTRSSHKFRKIASLHNVPELDLLSLLRWDRNPVDIERRMAALDYYDAITVLQPTFRSWFDEPMRQKVHVVPNPVYPAEVAPFSTRKNKIIYVGRLALPKRVHLLAEAWGKIAERFVGWTVEVYGTGPFEKQVRKAAERAGVLGSFHLMGETRDIEQVYQTASILAHPAEYEGWGLAVSEALAHGIPCIGYADCEGVNQLIRSGENGLLVSSEQPVDSLAAGLARLMSDCRLREKLAESAPGSVAQFSPQRVTSIWKEVIDG